VWALLLLDFSVGVFLSHLLPPSFFNDCISVREPQLID